MPGVAVVGDAAHFSDQAVSGEAAQGLARCHRTQGDHTEVCQILGQPANPSPPDPPPPNQKRLQALVVRYTPLLALMREQDSRLSCWEQLTTEWSSLFGLWDNCTMKKDTVEAQDEGKLTTKMKLKTKMKIQINFETHNKYTPRSANPATPCLPAQSRHNCKRNDAWLEAHSLILTKQSTQSCMPSHFSRRSAGLRTPSDLCVGQAAWSNSQTQKQDMWYDQHCSNLDALCW